MKTFALKYASFLEVLNLNPTLTPNHQTGQSQIKMKIRIKKGKA
jgi:hypothetical protein